MRIAIPSTDDKGLESEVSQHFGRAGFYTFVDLENGKITGVEFLPVPFEEHGPGDLPNFVREHEGEMVVAYGMGQKAIDFFNNMDIKVVTGAYGKISEVVNALIEQKLVLDENWKEHGDFGHEH